MSSKELSALAVAAGVPQDFRDAIGHVDDLDFLFSCSNTVLRAAIQNNVVTFPSQMVWLGSRETADVGRRVVQLYFVSGWPVRRICDRYSLTKAEVHGILREWRHRAIAVGFVQEIQSNSEERMPWSSETFTDGS